MGALYGKVPLTLDASRMLVTDPGGALEHAATHLFGQTKTEDFNQAVRSDDDICGLEIPMNDVAVMSAGKRAGNLNTLSQDRRRRQSRI